MSGPDAQLDKTGQLNRQLWSLAERHWQQDLSWDDYRRLRRRLVTEWSGEQLQAAPDDMDATQPVEVVHITIDEPAAKPPFWLLAGVLSLALVAALGLLLFILR